MTSPHEYHIDLRPSDPLAPQPEKVTVELKPHQLCALQKAIAMETNDYVRYDVPDPSVYIHDYYARRRITFTNKFRISTNIGILADMVGYGKTLTALAIVASVPCDQIKRTEEDIYSYHNRGYVNFTAVCPHRSLAMEDMFIRTTLVVVPRGPVYVQWENAIQTQTTLNVLAIDTLHTIRKKLPPPGSTIHVIKQFFENYDIVLIKSTTLKVMMDYYSVPFRDHPIQAWDRIMIDEAHDIINNIALFSFRFLWLISGTYQTLLTRTYGSRSQMSYAIREIIDEERMNLVLLRGQRGFVMQSFMIPPPIEHFYLCELPRNLTAIHPFLHPSIQQRINANDIAGAIRELGGQNETEDDIVNLVTREMEREHNNKQREISYIETLEIPNDVKQMRIQNLQTELNRIAERITSLKERVTCLDQQSCPICYDQLTNPIMLACTHVFCGACLLKWMQTGSACPECRAPIASKKLVAIVKTKTDQPTSDIPLPTIMSKEDTLFKLLEEKPDGQFLIFSKCDYTFIRIINHLSSKRIPFAEIKGSTSVMMNILERFRNRELRVILLNTFHAGSGIDMSCATDVVIFHSMGLDKMQAVGRAQRVGRTTPLVIHNLCYPNEMDDNSI